MSGDATLPTPGSAADQIRAAIHAAAGAIPFEHFMDLALYGEHGFYTAPSDAADPTAGTGSAGRRGHFITAPEVGPLFGAVLARLLDAEWQRLGRPRRFSVIEVGAGPGTLARSILAARPACVEALDYVAVEVSARQCDLHPADVRSIGAIADVADPGTLTGVVLANEVLDNVPFRLAVFDGAWREAYVAEAGDGRFAEVLSAPLDPLPGALPATAPHGARAPLQDAAGRLVKASLGLLAAGSVHVFDYCRPTTAELASLPWREWLRTYHGHERAGHYLADPGSCDITADVALDQLPPAEAVQTQAEFLAGWGIGDLVDEGRRHWAARGSSPDLLTMRMRSRVAEAEALLDPAGLGGFTALAYLV